jgi:hypothetical protein
VKCLLFKYITQFIVIISLWCRAEVQLCLSLYMYDGDPFFSELAQQGACWLHNPKVGGSKPSLAILFYNFRGYTIIVRTI